MTPSEAARLAAFCRKRCWWLDVRVLADGFDETTDTALVRLRLCWPPVAAEILTHYRRGTALAAIARLCDASDAYWDALQSERSAQDRVQDAQ
ncbi:MAG TPA: hypothetical protein VKT52_09285 [Ktedonobacterales bacterium]|nr:hypothetical protein [Ktedonobacterales bacterium]